MKRLLYPVIATLVFMVNVPASAQFSSGMSLEMIEQEVAVQLQARPLVEVVRALAEAGLQVESILAGLVSFIGRAGYESISLEQVTEAAIVAGLPPPAVVAGLITVVVERFGGIGDAQLDTIISTAVVADVAKNGERADVLAIARAAADTGKITLPEATAIAGAAEVEALVKETSEPLEEVEPVISTR